MKKQVKILIICLLIFVNFSNLSAQPYKSVLATDSIQWNVLHRFFIMVKNNDQKTPQLNQSFITLRHKIYGDSVINSITYRKIEAYSSFYNNSDFNGFIREDTNTGKVWFRRTNDNADRIIMDFSLNIGDTFKFITFPFNDTIKAGVDSVKYINGAKYIYFNKTLLFPEGRNICFMEGIGSNYIPFVINNYDNSPTTSLLCAYKNDIQIYNCKEQHPNEASGDTCEWNYFYGSVNEDENLMNYKIFPNPADDIIYIEFKDFSYPMNLKIEILNVLGRIVYSKNLENQNIQVPVYDLPQGMFFIKVSGGGKLIKTDKVLIAR